MHSMKIMYQFLMVLTSRHESKTLHHLYKHRRNRRFHTSWRMTSWYVKSDGIAVKVKPITASKSPLKVQIYINTTPLLVAILHK